MRPTATPPQQAIDKPLASSDAYFDKLLTDMSNDLDLRLQALRAQPTFKIEIPRIDPDAAAALAKTAFEARLSIADSPSFFTAAAAPLTDHPIACHLSTMEIMPQPQIRTAEPPVEMGNPTDGQYLMFRR